MSKTPIAEHLKRVPVQEEVVSGLLAEVEGALAPALSAVARERLRAHLIAPAQLSDEQRSGLTDFTVMSMQADDPQNQLAQQQARECIGRFEQFLANPVVPSDEQLDIMMAQFTQRLAAQWVAALTCAAKVNNGQCRIDEDLMPVPFPAGLWQYLEHPDPLETEGFFLGIDDVRQVMRRVKEGLSTEAAPSKPLLPHAVLALLNTFGITDVAPL